MKKVFLLAALMAVHLFASAQNVGVGLNTGIDARLHVAKADSGLAIFDNTTTLADSLKSRIFFKSGGSFTGAIGTHVTDPNGPYARLSFFTFGGSSSNQLKERLSITDGGNVGIGTVSPTALLDVAGTFRLRGNGAASGQVLTSDALGNATWQTPYTFTLPYSGTSSAASDAMRIINTGTSGGGGYFETSSTSNQTSALSGINNSVNGFGAGVYGRATAGTSMTTYGVRGFLSGTGSAGAAIYGSAANAAGVSGESTTGNGVQGISRAAGGLGGYFAGFTGADALRTVGDIRFGGIGEGAGKVLTSDASGFATWQAPGTALTLSATFSADQVIPSTTYTTVDFRTDVGNSWNDFPAGSFNNSTNAFTAPATGTYQFDVTVRLNASSGGISSYKYLSLQLVRTSSPYTTFAATSESILSQPGSTALINEYVHLTRLVKLTAGDVVVVQVYHTVTATSLSVINPIGHYSVLNITKL